MTWGRGRCWVQVPGNSRAACGVDPAVEFEPGMGWHVSFRVQGYLSWAVLDVSFKRNLI